MHPLGLQKVRYIVLFILYLSLLPSPQCKLDVLWSSHGNQNHKFPSQCVEECRTSHVQHAMCETFPLFVRPQRSMSLSLTMAGRLDGSSTDPAHGSEIYRSFVSHS